MKKTKNTWWKQFLTEDWIIVAAATVILVLAVIVPAIMPKMPKTLVTTKEWLDAGYMFVFLLLVTYLTSAILKKPLKGIFLSFLTIFLLALLSNVIASIPIIKSIGLESVFFAVILGLIISNVFKVPNWLKPAIQSEFYIKIGIITLGSTILFGEVMKAGAYGLAQAMIVVLVVWNFAFWVARKMKVDDEMASMLASGVSICGVSAAIATCGVIKGDNKKLSTVISLVLVIAIPMMYLLPWLSNLMGLSPDVAGAWLGGTIDTTGAVAAAGTMLGDEAAQTAIIVKSSQNVLLGIAAFLIALYWTYKGEERQEKPTAKLIWDRFPKFVVGFILASLIFSIFFSVEEAKVVGKITKGFSNSLFSIAFVCIGLETRFKEIFSKENRRPLKAFLTAQGVNIIITLIVAYILFGWLQPMLQK
ncbi:MAG TPA: putative sulfate exporter family transporter [Bacteroidales bacterium]|nr:putative sulfate exporter family transporter [Bacteroidales bacterium]HQB56253.1 putative sulfate exporter family transporter [Bacteroidales bacterium]